MVMNALPGGPAGAEGRLPLNPLKRRLLSYPGKQCYIEQL